jgi:hypothetical protein
VGIDEACTWYQLPNNTSPIAAGVAGLTVSPAATSTYMVKQDICGVIKYDTVVVYKDGVGLQALEASDLRLNLSPNPANDYVKLSFDGPATHDFKRIRVYNDTGQLLYTKELEPDPPEITINTTDFDNGVFLIRLETSDHAALERRFLISR